MARVTRAPCAICGGRLGGVRVRLAPGQVWHGPYRRCDVCGANFHTEHGVLVPSDETWMLAPSVLTVLDALRTADLDGWLDGGWGVDALVGGETRAHGDVDIVVELDRVDDVLVALAPVSYTHLTLPTNREV